MSVTRPTIAPRAGVRRVWVALLTAALAGPLGVATASAQGRAPASNATPKAKAKVKAQAQAPAQDADADDDGGSEEDGDDGDDSSPASDAPVASSRPTAPRVMGGNDDPRASADGIFFGDKLENDASTTLWQGSLTSSTMIYSESAGDTPKPATGAVAPDTASPFSRYYTDLRAQLDGKHLFGSRWDLRLDARGRFAPGRNSVTEGGSGFPYPTSRQSGLFGGSEYELRELYTVRGGDRSDLFIGRQYVLELAAVKIDGARFTYALSDRWNALAFAGAYPRRGSRSLDTDYPAQIDAMGVESGGLVVPFATGAGSSYRTSMTYGSFGVVGIVPLSDDVTVDPPEIEAPRVFVTASGYERLGSTLDVYHYLVVDVAGSAAFAVTNGSIGVNWSPHPRMRVTGAFHRVDTETLTVQAQDFLETPSPVDGLIQNNVEVLRIASDSARLGLSVALGAQKRFELSTFGAYRQRGDVTVRSGANATATIPGSQGGEVGFSALDRRSFLGLRVSASVSRFFGLGDQNYFKSESLIGRLAISREFQRGRGEWELEGGYVYSEDANREQLCDLTNTQTCLGSSKVSTPQGGATVSWRFATDWLVIGSLWASSQTLTIFDGGMDVDQPSILALTGFLRLGYRF